MVEIIKNSPAKEIDINSFLKEINFKLPIGFTEFYKNSDGAEIYKDETYCILWPVTEMIQLNKDYNVPEYAPNFFIFGSDGGGSAFCIEKSTGFIFEMPFIGMSNKNNTFLCKTFHEFISN